MSKEKVDGVPVCVFHHGLHKSGLYPTQDNIPLLCGTFYNAESEQPRPTDDAGRRTTPHELSTRLGEFVAGMQYGMIFTEQGSPLLSLMPDRRLGCPRSQQGCDRVWGLHAPKRAHPKELEKVHPKELEKARQPVPAPRQADGGGAQATAAEKMKRKREQSNEQKKRKRAQEADERAQAKAAAAGCVDAEALKLLVAQATEAGECTRLLLQTANCDCKKCAAERKQKKGALNQKRRKSSDARADSE
jgi:hypothetical protein